MILITFLLFFGAVYFVFIQNYLLAGFLLFASLGFGLASFTQKSSFIRLREQNVLRYLSDVAASQLQRNQEIQKHLELLSDRKEVEQNKRTELHDLIQKLQENKIKIVTIISNPANHSKINTESKDHTNDASKYYANKIAELKESDRLFAKFLDVTKFDTTSNMYEKIQERLEKLSDKITNRIETYNSSVAIYNSDLSGWDRAFVAKDKNPAEFYKMV